MDDDVIVWDLETVPDLAAVARIYGLPVTETTLIREALGEKFPKHLFHSIVCIGALIARRATIAGPWEVVALGAPHIGERTEAELIGAFVARIDELQPRLVTFNGAGFDLPVLRYRAMLHRIAAPGLSSRRYFHRYIDDSVDLCDVLSSFGRARATLHEISRMLGFAGKASGIDGAQVEQLVGEGRIAEVAAYCEEDVINTYRIWLVHELFCGRLSAREYEASEEIVASRGLTGGTRVRL